MTAQKIRVTAHNARKSAKGVFTARHNDRNFDPAHAPHIDVQKSAANKYWILDQDPSIGAPLEAFEDVERRFYDERFRAHLDAQNAKALRRRHADEVRTIDDYRKSERTCLEEQILQLGTQDDHAPGWILEAIFEDQLAWEREHFPQVKLVDAALHMDEATPHIHIRRAWIAHDKDGLEEISQTKALKEMGVERPDPSKPESRYNSAKMTYTRACRDHLIELCRENGLHLELTPREASKAGLSLEDYKAAQAKDRATEAQAELVEAKQLTEAARAERVEETERAAASRVAAEAANVERIEALNALERLETEQREVETAHAKRREQIAAEEAELKNRAEQLKGEAVNLAEIEKIEKKRIWSKKDKRRVAKTAAVSAQNAQEAACSKSEARKYESEATRLKSENAALQRELEKADPLKLKMAEAGEKLAKEHAEKLERQVEELQGFIQHERLMDRFRAFCEQRSIADLFKSFFHSPHHNRGSR
jgi:hypothetical protein